MKKFEQVDRVENYIRDNSLISDNNNCVIVAVSGGPDSVALLHILCNLGYRCICCHCNFHLRGPESDRDMYFVRDLAKKLEVEYEEIHFDTLSYANANHLSIEMAARDLRYDWFEKLSLKYDSKKIAVAHHSDDEVETFFINLTRGAGLHGLTGMRNVNNKIVRPLLCLSRNDIIRYLEAIGQDYVLDSTNVENEYMRNKFRNIIVPEFEKIKPSFKSIMSRNLENLKETESFLDFVIDNIRKECVFVINGSVRLSMDYLRSHYPNNWGYILGELLKPYGVNRVTLKSIVDSDLEESGKCFEGHNCTIVKSRNVLEILFDKDICNDKYYIDEVEGLVEKPVKMKLKILDSKDVTIVKNKRFLYADLDKISFPLCLRHWENGDFFYPFGAKGKKKISDFYVDEKLSAVQKKGQWLLCSNNEIIWIVGMRSDDRIKIDDRTQNVLVIELVDCD